MNENFENQTQFTAQEPFLVNNSFEQFATADSRLPEKNTDPKQKRKKLVLFSILGITIFFILVFVLLAASSNKKLDSGGIISLEEEKVSGQVSEFDELMSEIRLDLEAADPSINELPFPPVDLSTSLFKIPQDKN